MSPETNFGPTGRTAGGAACNAATGSTAGTAISQAEAKAWASFYTLAASDPEFAEAVTHLFEAEPLLRRRHLALYLCGQACLCQRDARLARRQRRSDWIKAATSFLAEHLLARPWAALKVIAHGQRDQQPLVLPAIVWNLPDAADLLRRGARVPEQPGVAARSGAATAAARPQSTSLVH